MKKTLVAGTIILLTVPIAKMLAKDNPPEKQLKAKREIVKVVRASKPPPEKTPFAEKKVQTEEKNNENPKTRTIELGGGTFATVPKNNTIIRVEASETVKMEKVDSGAEYGIQLKTADAYFTQISVVQTYVNNQLVREDYTTKPVETYPAVRYGNIVLSGGAVFQCDDKDYPQIKSRRFSLYLMTNLPIDLNNLKPTNDMIVSFLQSKGEATYMTFYNIPRTATGSDPTKAIIICETDFDSTGAVIVKAGTTIANLVYDDDIKSPGNVANTACQGLRSDISKYDDDGKGNYKIRLEGFTFGGYKVYPSGQAIYATTPALIATEFVTGVREFPGAPTDFSLSQNYPNPFNPSTKIKFNIPKQSQVKLIVYDILGREVAVLVNRELNAGSYEYVWDASNFPSGIYFYKIQAGSFVQTKKMLLLK